jgi:hypothetical protein
MLSVFYGTAGKISPVCLALIVLSAKKCQRHALPGKGKMEIRGQRATLRSQRGPRL